MSNSGEAGCFGIITIILDILIVIGSGFLAWNWVDPDSFGTGLLFVVVWGLLSTVGYFLVMLIVGLISNIIG